VQVRKASSTEVGGHRTDRVAQCFLGVSALLTASVHIWTRLLEGGQDAGSAQGWAEQVRAVVMCGRQWQEMEC